MMTDSDIIKGRRVHTVKKTPEGPNRPNNQYAENQ